jgi:hypothetical protein
MPTVNSRLASPPDMPGIGKNPFGCAEGHHKGNSLEAVLTGWSMQRRGSQVVLAMWIAVGLVLPTSAQQRPQNPSPDLPCDAFKKNEEGEWVAKRNVTVPAAFGMVEIKAGQPADEDLQERLDVQCK